MKLANILKQKVIKRIISLLLVFSIILGSIVIYPRKEEVSASDMITKTFNYTGDVQTFTPDYDGEYTFILYGASGGGENPDSDSCTGNIGGYGGRTEVVLNLTTEDTIYICVGGAGTGVYYDSIPQTGGYNGGGNAYHGGSSGGGATHIAISKVEDGTLASYVNNQSEVLAVAGGGGGSDNIAPVDNPTVSPTTGGNGGGLSGGRGTSYIDTYDSHLGQPGAGTEGGRGGTQNSGYAFGIGESTDSATDEDAGAGGGGWYGGYSGGDNPLNAKNCAGGGGSGYVNTSDSRYVSGITLQENHWGDGKVTVTYSKVPSYTITFNPNGGTCSLTTATVTTGKSDWNDVASQLPTWTGHTFKGWALSDGTLIYDERGYAVGGTGYWSADADSGGVWVGERNIEVYAQWDNNTNTITFDANGGTCSLTSLTVTYGSNAGSDVASQLPTREGHTFEGWLLSDGTTIYDLKGYAVGGNGYWSANAADGGVWVGNRDITVIAKWKNNLSPTISVTPASTDWCSSVNITYDITAGGNSGYSSSNSYQVYMSTSPTALTGGGWMNYSDGLSGSIGSGMNGTYYLFLKQIKNSDGNVSQAYGTLVTIGGTTYHRFGPYKFDNTAPTVNVSPSSNSTASKNLDITFTANDTGGSGLSNSNAYEYYLSSSASALSGGSWSTYSSGITGNIGEGLTGTYYLYLKQIKDNVGNMSIQNGTLVNIGGTSYHRFGPYVFDNTIVQVDDKPPVVDVTPSSTDWCQTVDVVMSAVDSGGSGLSIYNSYEVYVSTSPTAFVDGGWMLYATGRQNTIGVNMNGTYYLYLKRIYDQAGNVSQANGTMVTIDGDTYHMFGGYKFDNTAPTISVTPASKDWCKNTNVTITAADSGGSGLKSANNYQYYLSTSNTKLEGGTWVNYTSGTAFNIGSGKDGIYYLFTRRVEDNAGNISSANGTMVTIGGEQYHMFGAYKFDNTAPVVKAEFTPATTTGLGCTKSDVVISIVENGSGLKSGNSYQYYLSKSNTKLEGGSWTNYTAGTKFTVGSGLTGQYYLFVRQVNDNASNISVEQNKVTITGGTYHCFPVSYNGEPIPFDNTAPVITVTPTSAAVCNSVDVTIKAADTGSGLKNVNSYQYYLSSSSTKLQDGKWLDYNKNATVTLGEGLTGTYYLFVKQVYDNADNVSTKNGTIVTIDGVKYHRFGSYVFDNIAPIVDAVFTPNTTTGLGCTTSDVVINITEVGSGLKSNNSYQYYLSSSNTKLAGGTWTTYTEGTTFTVGSGLTGQYYLFVRQVYDNASNISVEKNKVTITAGTYHCFPVSYNGEPIPFDNTAPVITVTPTSATVCKTVDVTIKATDTGSGLKADNSYQYYLSSSSTKLQGGAWVDYNKDATVTLGEGLTGTYYLFVKQVYDNADNVSTKNGTLVTIGGVRYHRFGSYVFDNTAPVIEATPASVTPCNDTDVKITVTEVGSGLSTSNYQYYLSSSNNKLQSGSWKSYTSGTAFNIGSGLSGTYYLYVKQESDHAGNVSTTKGTLITVGGTKYHQFGPYVFDNIAPVISVNPSSSEWTNSLSLSVSATDEGGSGLKADNSYQYYLSSSSTKLQGGSWTNYVSGNVTDIGAGLNGTYYVFVKRIFDNAGNISSLNGTLVTVGSEVYHRFGPYKFDTIKPVVDVSPSNGGWWKSKELTVTVTDNSGSGIGDDTEYQYYLSNSATNLVSGDWKDYTSGNSFVSGEGLTGTYYLFVKRVSDKGGNLSDTNGDMIVVNGNTYHRFGEYKYDNTRPFITIDKTSCYWCNSTSVTITVGDEHSGLSQDNTYEYYLSNSKDTVDGGAWAVYSPGSAFVIGTGLSGEYYIWVRQVKDVVGNYSHDSAVVLLGGPYRFDNINPVITINTGSGINASAVEVVISASDEGGSQLSLDNAYEYYLSTDNVTPTGGEWFTYVSGEPVNLGEGLTGTYYLFVKKVKDNAGNWSNNVPYHISDGIVFDSAAPVVKVNKQSCEVCKTVDVIITASDEGTGLSDSNAYEYYLSTSNAALSGGTWISYTSGTETTLGIGLNGTYYLFVRSVYDNAGNISVTEGVIVTIGINQYHMFGEYVFDNIAPTGTVTYYENNTMLGLWGDYDSEPYAVMITDDATDNLSGIDRIYLELYDKANPLNKAEFDFTGSGSSYECVFNLYSALVSSTQIETVHLAVYVVDKVGNKGTLPITGFDFGTGGNNEQILPAHIGFIPVDELTEEYEYERDAFRVEARVINKKGGTSFRGGDKAFLEIYTYGYVEYVDATMESLSNQINPQYDDLVNLPKTAIPVQERYVYVHEFFVPLYAVESVYTDNVVKGCKKNLLQEREVILDVSGIILDDIKTILK